MQKALVYLLLFQSLFLCSCIRLRNVTLYNSTPEPLMVEIYEQNRTGSYDWSPSRSQIIAPREKQEIEAVIGSTNTLYKIEALNSQGQLIYRDVFDYRTQLKEPSILPHSLLIPIVPNDLLIHLYDMRLETNQ